MIPLDSDAVKVAQIGADSVWHAALVSGLVGAVGIAATLGTVWLTGKNERGRLKASQEHERLMHLEDVRREAYVTFSEALDEFRQCAFAVFDRNSQGETPEQRASGEVRLEEKIGALDRANHRIQMVGSEAARAIAQTITNHSANELRVVAVQQVHELLRRSIEALTTLERQFEAQARADVQQAPAESAPS